MTLSFRDALTADVGEAPKIAQLSTRVKSRSHHGRRERERRKESVGFSRTSREAALDSDSESDLEEEEALRHGPFGSHYHPAPRDGQQLFGDIYEMQDGLDKLVRFVQREVEGLAGGTSGTASTFSVLAFALEDWGR